MPHGLPTSFSASIITVTLVDDHAMVRQGLRSILGAYPDIVVIGEACNGEEAVTAVHNLSPAVVLMDINMPHMRGIEATRRIIARNPKTVVVGLSVNTDSDTRAAMLAAGAVTLITKEAAVDRLYMAIEKAFR
jgi:DNA-binding NarL/FixJ family response regulator